MTDQGVRTDRAIEGAVILYTQPHCGACRQVERYLEERGITFEVRDVLADSVALEEIETRGYLTTPVTQIGEEWIAGFQRKALDRALAEFEHA